MEISEARAILSAQGWLTKTPPAFRDAVLSGCELRHFSAGETIYAQGDRSIGLWGLASGTLGVEHTAHHHSPSFAFFGGTGFWAGAHTLVMGSERQVGLVALRPSALLFLSQAAFQTITREIPEAWRWLAVLPLLQNTLAFGTLEDLMIRDSRRRCAAILLRLAGCRGPIRAAEPGEIMITQEQLAEMINLSRTALGEVLRGFEAKEIISRKYGKLKINQDRLEAVLSKG